MIKQIALRVEYWEQNSYLGCNNPYIRKLWYDQGKLKRKSGRIEP